jgi:hypothetical protein
MERSGKSDEKTLGRDVKLLSVTFRTLFYGVRHLIY